MPCWKPLPQFVLEPHNRPPLAGRHWTEPPTTPSGQGVGNGWLGVFRRPFSETLRVCVFERMGKYRQQALRAKGR